MKNWFQTVVLNIVFVFSIVITPTGGDLPDPHDLSTEQSWIYENLY